MDNLGVVFLSELVGTAMLVLLGCGVVANVALVKNKGFNGGFLMVNIGWGLAVFAGVIVVVRLGCAPQPGRHARTRRQRRHGVRIGSSGEPGRPSSPTSPRR